MIGKIEKIIATLSLSLMAVMIVASPLSAETPIHDIDIQDKFQTVETLNNAVVQTKAHGDAYDAGHHKADKEIDGLPQLDFTTYTPQLFWMFVFFSLLYIIFAKKALPEISGTIEGRKNHIQSDLEAAEKLTADADNVHDAYNQGLVEAQNAANKTIQTMEDKMKVKVEKAMNDFAIRSTEEIQNAEDRIIAAKQAAMKDMNKIVTDVTAEAVEKIIGQSADKAAVQSTVEMLNEQQPKAKAA